MLSDPKAARRFPVPQLNPSAITQGSFYTGKSRDTKVLDLPDHDRLSEEVGWLRYGVAPRVF